MRKIVYSLGAIALLFMGSCQDDAVVENQVVPAQTGDEITFGSSLTDIEEQTRTIYEDEPVTDENGTYYPVTWEDGDQIAIYCPEASNANMVYYEVTPDRSNPSTSSAVTKVNTEEAGLQWGTEEVHHFSAFYPADRIVGLQNGKITAEIPVEQTPLSWKSAPNGAGGTTYTGVANTDYAFMWAYNIHNKSAGGDVALNFKPWVTILDVEINGPETADAAIKMSAVQLVSTTGETLNGQFTMDFTAVENDRAKYPTYEQAGEPHATRSTITIQLYDQSLNDGKGDFITLKHGDKIVVRFYLLPKDTNYDTSARQDLQLRVTPYNSAVLVRTLNAAAGSNEGTQAGGILAHKVNKVILPSVSQTGPNYWMSSLDPNIYVTELSLPGSRMSSLTEANGASTIYQDQTISEQFTNGVRAFYFQTGYHNDGGEGVLIPTDYNLYLAVNNRRLNRLRTYIQDIADGLAAAESAGRNQEFAFVLLSYSESASDGELIGNKERNWMTAVEEELKEMENESQYRLYTEEITPNTTIDDVKGKIIIKVNYNNQDMGNYLNADARVPAMFAIWDSYYRPEGNDLRWGTSNSNAPATMKWVYQEVTTVGPGGQTILADKKNYINQMFESSIDSYQNNSAHDMWFMNDCGGSFVGNVTGDYVSGNYGRGENTVGAKDLAQEMGIYVTNLLQSRTEDATLGIVYLNYANPTNPYSGNLIQTIINNNFSFQLRTRGSSQSNVYNASYSKGGNAIGWDK
ncbi:hypothetical protein [Phocaeicola salanitronis]|uniref:hypothetical protein n=1 Tax=Phocaeicola salanitronis TaxID=376805 RepID=UPI0025A4C2CA|nr:hypothetical protein [Phocaeicola salanitronis]MDM8305020.1 hypothetical protein [Phocaeicola salanitronis]